MGTALLVEAGMKLYRSGSPSHAARFAMPGDRRSELEDLLHQHLRDCRNPGGSITETTYSVVIRARRT